MSTLSVGSSDALTVGELAEHFGVSRHLARVMSDRLGASRRIGHFRIIPVDQLDRIEAALIGGGHLTAGPREAGNANAPAAGPR
jgi:hypothetical protein